MLRAVQNSIESMYTPTWPRGSCAKTSFTAVVFPVDAGPVTNSGSGQTHGDLKCACIACRCVAFVPVETTTVMWDYRNSNFESSN